MKNLLKNNQGFSAILLVMVLASLVLVVSVRVMKGGALISNIKSKIYTSIDNKELEDEFKYLVGVDKNCTASLKGIQFRNNQLVTRPRQIELFHGDDSGDKIVSEKRQAINLEPVVSTKKDKYNNNPTMPPGGASEIKKESHYQSFGLLKIDKVELLIPDGITGVTSPVGVDITLYGRRKISQANATGDTEVEIKLEKTHPEVYFTTSSNGIHTITHCGGIVAVVPPGTLAINATNPNLVHDGEISLTGGVPGETITIEVEFTNLIPFNNDSSALNGNQSFVDFDIVNPPSKTRFTHLTAKSSLPLIVLDASGNAAIKYDGLIDPAEISILEVTIRIIARSSAAPIPAINSQKIITFNGGAVVPPPPLDLIFTSKLYVAASGLAQFDVNFGEDSETLDITITLSGPDSSFVLITSIGSVTPVNKINWNGLLKGPGSKTKNGTISLDAAGKSTFVIDTGLRGANVDKQAVITIVITGRSSGKPIPTTMFSANVAVN